MDLEFTRGDTKNFQFQLKDASNNEIVLGQNDLMFITFKKNYNTADALFQKTLTNGINYEDGFYKVSIDPIDTNSLPYGSYVFDIQIKSDAIVKTILLGTMTITQEVTFVGNEV